MAPPSTAFAGAILPSPVTVSVEDSSGDVLINDNSTVTLTIASGPPGAMLGGTVIAAVVDGVATFANLSLNLPGTYTLSATDGALTPATSPSFSILPPAARLAFTMLPYTQVPIATVSVEDANGNVVASDNSTVTLSFVSTVVGNGLGTTQTFTAMAINGVATFANVFISPGFSYSLTASDGTLASITSIFQVNGTPLPTTPASVEISVLANLNQNPINSNGIVMDSDGNLYGSTQNGGLDNYGSLLEWTKNGGYVTTIATFNGADGSYANGGLIIDSAGNLIRNDN